MLSIVIVGATSAIAQATARRYAEKGARFVLVARNANRLQAVAADLKARGAEFVATEVLDVRELQQHERIRERALDCLGRIDLVLLAHGTLVDQADAERSIDVLVDGFAANAVSTMALATHFSAVLEAQGSGCLAVISSVAGDRGRGSNYVYGAAKAAVTAFLGGLRNRLSRSGVHVVTIKPGLIDSPMTAHLRKGFLWSTPERVAKDIEAAVDRKRDVVYTPGYWRFVMMAIRAVPERIFKRLSL